MRKNNNSHWTESFIKFEYDYVILSDWLDPVIHRVDYYTPPFPIPNTAVSSKPEEP